MSSSESEVRRALLKGVTVAPFWLVSCNIMAKSVGNSYQWYQTLKALLDEIIPADETPSATQLNVHNDILSYGAGIANYHLMLVEGTSWLNHYSKQVIGGDSFERISKVKRIEVLNFAFASQLGSLPRVFVERIRTDAFRLYYQKQESYSSILSMRPIQPFGYPDHQTRI
jgi:hypothetical protein